MPAGSRCPTFAACVLAVDNERWRGVPFLLSAGKGLDERLCELRVRLRLMHLAPVLHPPPHPPSPAATPAPTLALTRGHTRPHPPCNRTQQVRFKPQPYNRMMGVDSANELVLRVQPDEVTPG